MPTLHWIGKEKVINHHLDVPFKILEHSYGFDNGVQTDTETNSGNKIIHGDNLAALKALLPEYEGRIKCIYIDPPYNTGNEGWVYNDNVNDPKFKKWLHTVVGKEGEDLSRHDNWLCMMYPRLKLLHKLLAEDGAIFISIDDNELANLKLICEEIFGTNNFITSISWFKKVSPSNDAKWFSNDHEYIFVFAKNKSIWFPKKLALSEKQKGYYTNPDNDPRGDWNSSTYTCNKTSDERPNLYYPLINPNSGNEIWPKKTAVWAYSKEQSDLHLKDNLIYFGANGDAKMPRFKKFLTGSKGVVPRTIWHYDDSGHTQEATQVLRQVLGDVFFTTPKPPRLIERILQLSTDKNSIILDSFAGSGTTAHAVLNLNKQDEGNRKFICIEMEDYAETITAERVKKVIKGYGSAGSPQAEGIESSFDYYTLGESLFNEDGNINEAIGIVKIRAYIWYSETQTAIALQDETKEKAFLGKHNDTAYYFHYKHDNITTLDHQFLSTIKTKAEQYVVYADNCILTKDYLTKRHIIFKKIPRDIRRF